MPLNNLVYSILGYFGTLQDVRLISVSEFESGARASNKASNRASTKIGQVHPKGHFEVLARQSPRGLNLNLHLEHPSSRALIGILVAYGEYSGDYLGI